MTRGQALCHSTVTECLSPCHTPLSHPKHLAFQVGLNSCNLPVTDFSRPGGYVRVIIIKMKPAQIRKIQLISQYLRGFIPAGGGTRTHTPSRTADFESASSAIPTRRHLICKICRPAAACRQILYHSYFAAQSGSCLPQRQMVSSLCGLLAAFQAISALHQRSV